MTKYVYIVETGSNDESCVDSVWTTEAAAETRRQELADSHVGLWQFVDRYHLDKAEGLYD